MLQDMSVRHTDIYPLEQVHSYFNLLTILNSLWVENISLLSSCGSPQFMLEIAKGF